MKRNNKRYIFNEESLSYEPLIFNKKQKLWKGSKWFISSFIFGITTLLVVSNYVDSPKEKYLKRELEFLKYNYSNLSKKVEMSNKVLANMHDRDNNIYRALLEVDPIPDEIMEGGFGGIDRYKNLSGYRSSDLIKEITKKVDLLTNKMYLQSKSLDIVSDLVKNKEKMLKHIPAIQPVDDGLTRLVSGFGFRYHPILKQRKMHYGVDFAAKIGVPVYATGDAKVEIAGYSGGFGKYIVLNHGYGYKTLYAHLSHIDIKRWQKVKRGMKIGEIGNTGRSTGPHLHYEIHKEGKKVNPINYYYKDLTPEEYKLIVEKSERDSQTFD